MKIKLYAIIKQIHLYSTLLTVALLIMYIVTSYMMIYHDTFKVEEQARPVIKVELESEFIDEGTWESLLSAHNIKGRLIRENQTSDGSITRLYENANSNSAITISSDLNTAEIKIADLNLSGSIVELHRMRGYGGPIQYNLYAFMLDLTGISLLLFAVTGVILWLKLLKFNKIAWAIFIFGFLYVGSVIIYLWKF